MVGTLMINFVMAMTTGSRFSGGRTSYRSLQASKRLRALPVVRLLWSILAGRLLHVLTTASGTTPRYFGTAAIASAR